MEFWIPQNLCKTKFWINCGKCGKLNSTEFVEKLTFIEFVEIVKTRRLRLGLTIYRNIQFLGKWKVPENLLKMWKIEVHRICEKLILTGFVENLIPHNLWKTDFLTIFGKYGNLNSTEFVENKENRIPHNVRKLNFP